jgi:hypothetical protein
MLALELRSLIYARRGQESKRVKWPREKAGSLLCLFQVICHFSRVQSSPPSRLKLALFLDLIRHKIGFRVHQVPSGNRCSSPCSTARRFAEGHEMQHPVNSRAWVKWQQHPTPAKQFQGLRQLMNSDYNNRL